MRYRLQSGIKQATGPIQFGKIFKHHVRVSRHRWLARLLSMSANDIHILSWILYTGVLKKKETFEI